MVCSCAAIAARSQLTGKHALPLCGLQVFLTFVGGLAHRDAKTLFPPADMVAKGNKVPELQTPG